MKKISQIWQKIYLKRKVTMHKSVLLEEAIESLQIKEDGKYIDATLGYAGHSSEILKRI